MFYLGIDQHAGQLIVNLRNQSGDVLLRRQVSKPILRIDPAMRAWFKKLKRKRGSKVARVAVMRRMATIIWRLYPVCYRFQFLAFA